MTIPISNAISFLKPYNELLYACVMNAWDDYIEKYSHVRHIHSSTTRANIIHSHMVYHAQNLFEDVKGANFIEKNKLLLLNLHDKVLLKFKKLDENKFTGNIKTQQTLNFLEQDLPFMPAHATNLVVGYELNQLQTNISAITVTCPKNSSEIQWHFDLVSSSKPDIVKMPFIPKPVLSDAVKRVKVKEIKKDKEKYG